MCEQCCADAVSYGEPLPGFYLVKARRTGHSMKDGQWGLVECNDPFAIWTATPCEDPTHGWTDEQLEASGNDDIPGEDAFIDGVGEFRDELFCNPLLGHRLVEAAKTKGYNPEDHGFEAWLFHHLGVFLKTAKPTE
jgi:hypothetical protein